MTEACLGFLQLLFCGTVRQKGTSSKTRRNSSEEREKKVKIRVGFEGKDTLFSVENLNVKTTFGQYAVLLDYASNKLVPLHSSGSVMEPLEARRRYVVVLNTHGSSSHKWDDLRKSGNSMVTISANTSTSPSPSKKHRKHGSGKHSSKKKRSGSSSTSRSSSKVPSKHERAGEEVKEPLLVEKEEEDDADDVNDSEEEEEKQKEKEDQQEQHVTNFATIDFGVSSSMDSMISNSREVYVY